MARKTGVDGLSLAINSILSDYGSSISENVSEAVKRVSKSGAKAVREESRKAFKTRNKKKPYYRGWTFKTETEQMSAYGIIYNRDVPGLPHLLEHGHAKRNGGRVPGRAHIAPVEEEIIESFTRELERGI